MTANVNVIGYLLYLPAAGRSYMAERKAWLVIFLIKFIVPKNTT